MVSYEMLIPPRWNCSAKWIMDCFEIYLIWPMKVVGPMLVPVERLDQAALLVLLVTYYYYFFYGL
uniref:Uncharacterized protein n=1 Tax=Nelumbo nucifera TaxID=4432 RepID=A0A822XNK8_NELNU|nr:TPA_asm: hypothetical protein HUJ06_021989 [Nelumbo nucifera]